MTGFRGALRRSAPRVVLYLTFGVAFLGIVPRLMWRDADGISVGHEHLWSDWPLHLGMARRFADTPVTQWLAHHPMLGGVPLRYPFVAAWISGMAMRAGASPEVALLVPTLLLLLLLLEGMTRFWRHASGPWRALVAVALFFLGAGPGGFAWIADSARNGVDTLWLPPREYGRVDDYGWYAGNFLTGMLLPQRAFLPGMTAAVWLLHGLQRRLDQPGRSFLPLGLGFGLLPLAHVHSAFAAAVLALWMLGTSPQAREPATLRRIAVGGAAAVVVAGAVWICLLKPVTPYPGFVSWHPGFAARSLSDWLVMWWRLWGLALPVALFGTLLPGRRAVASAGWCLFAVANLILFQPIAWDNSKVFLWSYFALCGAMADVLARLWRHGIVGRTAATALAASLSLTGLAEFVALSRPADHAFRILDRDDLVLGEAIRARTAPDAVFLTGMDIGNAPMSWGGRPIYLGFTGWMPNFGFDPRRREEDVRAIYAGWPDARERLERARIAYVLVGPEEMRTLGARTEWFAKRFPVFARSGPKTIYSVGSSTP